MQNLWWMTNHHALANENGLPDEEKSLRYHRKFRLSVMKLKFKCQSYTTQAKRGRPAKNEETTRKSLGTPEGAPKPKEMKSILLWVLVNGMARIVYIRYAVMEEDYKSRNQEVHVEWFGSRSSCYVYSNDAKGWGKAASSEMYHHINCLRDAHQTCKITKSNDSPLNDLCDVQILMYLLSSVYTEPYNGQDRHVNDEQYIIGNIKG